MAQNNNSEAVKCFEQSIDLYNLVKFHEVDIEKSQIKIVEILSQSNLPEDVKRCIEILEELAFKKISSNTFKYHAKRFLI